VGSFGPTAGSHAIADDEIKLFPTKSRHNAGDIRGCADKPGDDAGM